VVLLSSHIFMSSCMPHLSMDEALYTNEACVFRLTIHHCYELSCDDIINLLLCLKSVKEVVLSELSQYVKQRPGGRWIMDVRAPDQIYSLNRLLIKQLVKPEDITRIRLNHYIKLSAHEGNTKEAAYVERIAWEMIITIIKSSKNLDTLTVRNDIQEMEVEEWSYLPRVDTLLEKILSDDCVLKTLDFRTTCMDVILQDCIPARVWQTLTNLSWVAPNTWDSSTSDQPLIFSAMPCIKNLYICSGISQILVSDCPNLINFSVNDVFTEEVTFSTPPPRLLCVALKMKKSFTEVLGTSNPRVTGLSGLPSVEALDLTNQRIELEMIPQSIRKLRLCCCTIHNWHDAEPWQLDVSICQQSSITVPVLNFLLSDKVHVTILDHCLGWT
jgi:hypothetical protein